MDNEKLIEIVKQYRFLYDPNEKKYSDSLIKERAWREIGVKLKMNGRECKKAWALLRDAFRRSIKNKRDAEASNGFEKRWKYVDEMSFLLPYLWRRPAREKSNADEEVELALSLERHSPEGIQSEVRQYILPTSPAAIDYLPKNTNSKNTPVDIEQFMAGMTTTLGSFPPRERAIAKAKIFEIVSQMEIEILSRATSSVDSSGSANYDENITTQDFCQVYLAPKTEDIKYEQN